MDFILIRCIFIMIDFNDRLTIIRHCHIIFESFSFLQFKSHLQIFIFLLQLLIPLCQIFDLFPITFGDLDILGRFVIILFCSIHVFINIAYIVWIFFEIFMELFIDDTIRSGGFDDLLVCELQLQCLEIVIFLDLISV